MQATKAINKLWNKGESFTVLLLLRWSYVSPSIIAINYCPVASF
jgi:hypothetical protein